MGLESTLNGFKKKIVATALLGSLLAGCSSDSNGPTNANPSNPKPPVQTQNKIPVINSSPLTKIGESSFYEYQVQATDPDGDPLSYSIEGPPWLSVSHNFVSGNSPDVFQDTSVPVKVRVSDGKGFTEQSYNLNVMNLFNTYVLSSDQISTLSGVTQNSLSFSQPMNFAVKDFIGAGISAKTPYGILREITSVSSDRKTFYTSQAALEQIVNKASLSFGKNLSPSDIQSSIGMEGVSTSPAQSQAFNFGVSLNNVVLYDGDGNENTKNDQIIANGDISFNTDFSFKVDIDDFALKYLRFQNVTNETADIIIGSNLIGIASQKEIKIREYNFKPSVIGYIPTPVPIPIVVTPKIGIYVSINPTQANPLGLRVKQDATLDAKLIYDGVWFKNSDFSNIFNFSIPNPSGNWNLQVSAGPQLKLLLYDVAGPVAGVNSTLRLDSKNGDWKLYGGLEAYLGVTMNLFSKKIGAYTSKVLDYEKLLAEKTGLISGPQKTDTILAGKDAHIAWSSLQNSTFPNTNYNNPILKLKRDEGRSYEETLIQFPLNSLPSGAVVSSAKMNMYGSCVGNSGTPTVNIDLRKITGNWGESSVTWNSKPNYNPSNSSSFSVPVRTNFNTNHDITSLAQEWQSNNSQNYGVALILYDNQMGCSLNSRESTDPIKRPMLIVSYR